MNCYIFGDFILNEKDGLFRNGKVVSLPPKEFAVLTILAKHHGKLVSKEKLINEVWSASCVVSDESLTRCVYMIRKTLGETSAKKYIDTIYGKGYRFTVPVSKKNIEETSEAKSSLVAMLPFSLEDKRFSRVLFDYLSGVSSRFDKYGFTFMASAMTVNNMDLKACCEDLKMNGVAYFLTGMEVVAGKERIAKIELIGSHSLRVVERSSVSMSGDVAIDLINCTEAVDGLLKRAFINADKKYIKDIADTRSCYYFYSSKSRVPAVLSKEGRTLTSEIMDYDPDTLCVLAGSFLSLSLLDAMEESSAGKVILNILERALETEPRHMLALSLRSLMLSSEEEEIKENEFHLAMVLSPLSAEVYYYYACYLTRERDYEKAMRLISMAMTLNGEFKAAKILYVVITYLTVGFKQALSATRAIMGSNKACDVILNGILVVLYLENENGMMASECMDEIKRYKDDCLFVRQVYEFYMSRRKHRPAVLAGLKKVGESVLK